MPTSFSDKFSSFAMNLRVSTVIFERINRFEGTDRNTTCLAILSIRRYIKLSELEPDLHLPAFAELININHENENRIIYARTSKKCGDKKCRVRRVAANEMVPSFFAVKISAHFIATPRSKTIYMSIYNADTGGSA